MMDIAFDYATLRVIWWILLGVLLIGLAVMDGFDFGVGALLPFVARQDIERRVVINTVGPVWESNQVWFILGGGAIFAAWPHLYALSFSGFYLAMLLLLSAMILRPVGFKYRSKQECPNWRSAWDWALFVGGFVPALVFGVAVGNVIQGVPYHFDEMMRPIYTGSFWALFNPFALLCGLLSVAMLLQHGAAWLTIKTEGAIHERARTIGMVLALVALLLFAVGGVWVWLGIDGYAITSAIDPNGPSNPVAKMVERSKDGWWVNYSLRPYFLICPLLGLVGMALSAYGFKARCPVFTWWASAAGIFGIISTVGVAMFPFLLPSSSNPSLSLTVWDASSSFLTLVIMLVVVIVFLPIVLGYVMWAYRVMKGPVRAADIQQNSQAY